MRDALPGCPAQPPPRKNSRRNRLPPGLLRRVDTARYLGIGVSTLDRLNAAGLVPAPIRLGGALAWNRRELAAFIDHGCPPRGEWTAIWQSIQAARRAGRAR